MGSSAAGFDSAQDYQQLLRRNRPYRLCAHPGKNICLQTPDDSCPVLGNPLGRKLGVPLARDALERVDRVLYDFGFAISPFLNGVNAIGDELPGRFSPLACFGEWDVRIDTQTHPPFFARQSIFQAPPAASGGSHFQIHPATVREAS